MIVERLERADADRLVLGVPRDRAERVDVGDALAGAHRGGLARRVLRDADERLRLRDRFDRRVRVRLADALERFERDVAQHGDRLSPHVLVRVGGGERGKRCGIQQLRDGGAPNARVGVLASDLGDQLALVERQLLHERETDRGIGMLVPRLGAEPIEDRHTRSSLAERQLVSRRRGQR